MRQTHSYCAGSFFDPSKEKIRYFYEMTADRLEQLRERLSHPLPGDEAHILMMPKLSSGHRVKFNHVGTPRKGAVLMLLYEKDGELHFPLIQRPVYQGVHSGQVGLPGGKMEPDDPDLCFTALREAKEEVGIIPEAVNILGTLSEFFVAASNHMVLPVVGYAPSTLSFTPDQYEVEEVIEARLSELLDESRRKETEIETAQGYKLFSPYFDIQGKVVWGATAMMLNEFVEIMRKL